MSQTYTTTCIILKRRDYQENDRFFCIYTKDYGKLDVLAKGTKKIKSKLNSYLEPFYYVNLMIAKGKVFDKLANANLIDSYQNLRTDDSLVGFYLLNYIGETTDGLIQGGITETRKFNLLLEILEILNQEITKESAFKKEKLLMLANIYILKLLSLLGYQPEIKRCLICHRGLLLTKHIFDFRSGGLVCEECKKVCLIEDYLRVSDDVIKIFQLAKEKELPYFIELGINKEVLDQFNQVVYKLILANLERPLKSLEFMKIPLS